MNRSIHIAPSRVLRRLAAIALGVATIPAAAVAQGNLSTQGLGYPQGGLSTRALSTGGALTETDPSSAVNPAALASFGSTTLYFQYEPEFRRVSAGANSDYTVTTRFPLMMAAIPVGDRWAFAFSTSNFLDRTWSTQRAETVTVRGTPIGSISHLSSDGSIADVRLAAAYVVRQWLRLGVAGHVFSGSNRLADERTFSDSAVYKSVRDSSSLSYAGSAVSAGAEIIVPRGVAIGVSARHGGEMRASRGDSTLSRANVPDRFGASLAYIGISSTTIGVRTALDRWSAMSGLVSNGVRPRDAWDTSVGADVAGPHWGAYPMQLRAGLRWRTLPFPVVGFAPTPASSEVKERSASFGLGTVLARGRASLELGAVHSTRSAPVGAAEHAWTISLGLTVRP